MTNFIRKCSSKFVAWCADDTPAARFERTVAQGIVGVMMSMLSAWANAPEWVTISITPLTMAVLSPVQSYIGGGKNADK